MDNIVLFPNIKKDSPVQSIEEIKERVQSSKIEHIKTLIESCLPMIFERAQLEGFDISNDECDNMQDFFIETYAALLCKSVGIEHPLHENADFLFGDDDQIEFKFDLDLDEME